MFTKYISATVSSFMIFLKICLMNTFMHAVDSLAKKGPLAYAKQSWLITLTTHGCEWVHSCCYCLSMLAPGFPVVVVGTIESCSRCLVTGLRSQMACLGIWSRKSIWGSVGGLEM